MDKTRNSSGSETKQHRWPWLVLGCILFGLLMGLRSELHSIWLRSATAGLAFVVLFSALRYFRKPRP